MRLTVNIEEKIGKTAGRRQIKDSLEYGFGLQKCLRDISEADPQHPRFPKGVYRFRSFEEADEWTMRYLTARRS